MDKLQNGFTFLVVAYNHEKYIIEHLESIKYQIESYAQDFDVDLIVNDDCSKDKTVLLVDSWLNSNNSIFRKIIFLKNPENIGTCASVINMLANVSTDAAKLTAGDDVYSYENIFEYALLSGSCAFLSGIALDLTDGVLSENKIDTFNAIATEVIYKRKPLFSRFKHLSLNNAPNIIYSMECLRNLEVQSHLKNYDVVEDWPLQIAISRQYPSHHFKLVYKTFVYYRRTMGSTYIIANNRFTKDKTLIYDFLIAQEKNYFDVIRLKVRKWCFCKSNAILNKIVNLDFYIYLISTLIRASRIIHKLQQFDSKVTEHSSHYEKIRDRAIDFIYNQ